MNTENFAKRINNFIQHDLLIQDEFILNQFVYEQTSDKILNEVEKLNKIRFD